MSQFHFDLILSRSSIEIIQILYFHMCTYQMKDVFDLISLCIIQSSDIV